MLLRSCSLLLTLSRSGRPRIDVFGSYPLDRAICKGGPGCEVYRVMDEAAAVGGSVGVIIETANLSGDRLLLLGPLQVIRNGTERTQPPSRKVRALLAYLAMAPRPVSRERLCELFWDVAD